jgi:hypothetical protein
MYSTHGLKPAAAMSLPKIPDKDGLIDRIPAIAVLIILQQQKDAI